MLQGWSLDATLKLPANETALLDLGSSSGAWTVESQHWVGYYADTVVWDANQGQYVQGANRYLYALMFGRNAAGETIVRAYGTTSERVVSADYHDYQILYDAQTGSANLFIDGEFWMNYAGSRADAASTATRFVYWGDNSSQPGDGVSRATYWESVSLSIVPEPKPALLMVLALSFIFLQRSRSTQFV